MPETGKVYVGPSHKSATSYVHNARPNATDRTSRSLKANELPDVTSLRFCLICLSPVRQALMNCKYLTIPSLFMVPLHWIINMTFPSTIRYLSDLPFPRVKGVSGESYRGGVVKASNIFTAHAIVYRIGSII